MIKLRGGATSEQIVSSELWDAVNKKNKRLMEDFLSYKKTSDRSSGTIKQYKYMLRIFFAWNCKENDDKFFVDIKKREFIRFFHYAAFELRSSPNRIATVKSALSSLSNYIEDILDDEYPNYKNSVKKIEVASRKPVKEKTILTMPQVKRCLDKLVKDKHYQIACYMALAVASGARRSELLRFKCSYFDPKNIVFGCLYKTPEKIQTKGRGEKGKQLYKYTFVDQFKPYFDMWMIERGYAKIDSEWLFVARKKDNQYIPLNQSSITHWAKVISKYLDCDFYFHSLRHLWCTELKKKNLPDTVIQQLQGWSDPKMINIYSDLEIEDILGDYFDENGIKEIKSAKLTDI